MSPPRKRQRTINLQKGGLGPPISDTPPRTPSETPSEEPPYTFRLRSERTFEKNNAIQRTCEVRFDDKYLDRKLSDITADIHRMIEEILISTRGDLSEIDLAMVCI